MNQLQTPLNEEILVGTDGTQSTIEELRTSFLKRRETDDDFARDYRKGEFYEWLSAEGYTAL